MCIYTFLDFGTSWKLMASFMPGRLFSGKVPPYAMDRRLGGHQSLSGKCRVDKIRYSLGTRILTDILSRCAGKREHFPEAPCNGSSSRRVWTC
jgi:hypothetical protein